MSKKRKRKQWEYNQKQHVINTIKIQKIDPEINLFKRILRLIDKIVYGVPPYHYQANILEYPQNESFISP